MPDDGLLAELLDTDEWQSRPARSRPKLYADQRHCSHVGGTDPCSTTRHACQCGATIRHCNMTTLTHDSVGNVICSDCLASPRCERCHKRTDCTCVVAVVHDYHSPRESLALPALSPDDEPLIGVEIEAVWPGQSRSALDGLIGPALHTVKPVVWAIERDSSLGGEGAEVITRPFPLSLMREVLPTVCAAIATAGGTVDARCGGHIHVTRTAETLTGAQRVNGLYGRPDQSKFWDAVCHRDAKAYRSGERNPNAPSAPQVRVGGYIPTERHALWATRQTIEWRHPSGTLDPRVWIGRIELILDCFAHASKHPTDGTTWSTPWGIGQYLKDRPRPTSDTRYAFALRRSVGY